MCTFIGVECLAANALIALYSRGIQKISFRELADYGLCVVEQYKRENEEQVILIFDPDDLFGLVLNYSDYFKIDVVENSNEKYICLKEGVEINEIKEQFRWSLSYAMLKALSQVDIFNVISN